MAILVTGAAGFIGSHVAERLLARGDLVVGLDDLNAYYDPALKEARLARLRAHPNFRFVRADVADRDAVARVFAEERFAGVVHLAAQAGVRYSIDHPHAYVAANVTGFLHVLEGCRATRVGHLVYASSSSVYGLNARMPFAPEHGADHPVSLYAATKKANELMAHAYSHLYGIPTTGLRFFTVYGPWGRPDMALFTFTRAILAGEPVDVYNHGEMARDFTYVDDVAEGVVRTLDRPAAPDPAWAAAAPSPEASSAPYRVYNIGNSDPVPLSALLDALEAALGRRATRRLLPLQPGDVVATYADVGALQRDVGFAPRMPVAEGVRRFVAWYVDYYQVPGVAAPPPAAAVPRPARVPAAALA